MTGTFRQRQVARAAAGSYRARRRAEYPAAGEQLDAIWKALAGMPGQLPAEAQAVLDQVNAVKAKHPKPGGGGL